MAATERNREVGIPGPADDLCPLRGMPPFCTGPAPNIPAGGANGCRSVGSVGSFSKSESISVLVGTWPSEHHSNLAAGFSQHCKNTIAQLGFLSPNPIPRPFETEAVSEPDLLSPLAFSESLYLGAVFCNCLGPPKRSIPKKVGIRARNLPTPIARGYPKR
jgi:hypothetical protein